MVNWPLKIKCTGLFRCEIVRNRRLAVQQELCKEIREQATQTQEYRTDPEPQQVSRVPRKIALPDFPRKVLPEVPRKALPDVPREALQEVPRKALPEVPRKALPNAPRKALPDVPRKALPDDPRKALQESDLLALLGVSEEALTNAPRKVLPEIPRPQRPDNLQTDGSVIRNKTKKPVRSWSALNLALWIRFGRQLTEEKRMEERRLEARVLPIAVERRIDEFTRREELRREELRRHELRWKEQRREKREERRMNKRTNKRMAMEKQRLQDQRVEILRSELQRMEDIQKIAKQRPAKQQHKSPEFLVPYDNTSASESNVSLVMDGRHYLNLLNSHTTAIDTLCRKYEQYTEKPNMYGINEDALGEIQSAIGKAKLLVNSKNSKFEQLRGLCAQNMDTANVAGKAVTVGDLAGFWDMVFLQVGEIERMFVRLAEMKKNSWAIMAESKPNKAAKVILKKAVAKKAVVAKKVVVAKKDEVAKPSVSELSKQRLAEAKKKAAELKLKNQDREDFM